MNQDVFFRAHTVTPEKSRKNGVEQSKWPEYTLIFDAETTTDTSQSLSFGAYRFCRQTPNGAYVCLEEGLFHADDINSRSLKIVQEYVRDNTPDTPKDSPDKLSLHPRSEFVEKVLWEAIQAGAMVVGFNLPFDLSRIAVDWCKARNGGWSLVLSVRRSRKTGETEPNPDRPRIRVTSKDSKSAFITLMRPRIAEEWPSGRFLDLHTLASALHSESYSLDRACAVFGVRGKLKHEPTGKISSREIDYCREDVRATADLLNAMRQEFDLHPIQLLPDRAYSAASIAKAYLDAMAVIPPKDKFKTAHRILGIAMQAYYGGRAECRIRRVPVPIVHTDFMSQYPSVNALLGNGDVLTADTLTFADVTIDIRKLLTGVTLEDAFNPCFWKQLKFFALVCPNEDILPVRAVYNNETQNIGINRFSSKKPIWFAGPDVIASVLLTGKVPRIEKARPDSPRKVSPAARAWSLLGTEGPAQIPGRNYGIGEASAGSRSSAVFALHHPPKCPSSTGKWDRPGDTCRRRERETTPSQTQPMRAPATSRRDASHCCSVCMPPARCPEREAPPGSGSSHRGARSRRPRLPNRRSNRDTGC